ncbi:MAG: helix-turn-helix transcriptional regulator [Crocinitomicaceae bacterium]|nr:helix-turn-helix transcriptional regulator [Crocinitomicaceae bacterium]
MSDKSYRNRITMSDASFINSIGRFIKSNRLKQNKTQGEIADSAGISRSTLSLLERGQTVTIATLIQVLRVLDLLSVMDVFETSDEISPLAYAKLIKKQRKRASSKSKKTVKVKEELDW